MNTIPPTQITDPETFILESLTLADEKEGRLDGKLLYDALKLFGIKPIYNYFRTERELLKLSEVFRNSGYRYIHLSCHGQQDRFAFTLNNVPFDKFAEIFKEKLNNRRLFISGCELGNRGLADAVFGQNGGMYSVIAPKKPIFFDQSLVFWTSFYYRMYAYSRTEMKKEQIKKELDQLSKIFEVEMSYFWKNTKTKGINSADFPEP
ncbi:hypothetical protein D4S03_01610 [bacterium]|nr:MAG: hypothetical protein D4S03_01610 [bacterium]